MANSLAGDGSSKVGRLFEDAEDWRLEAISGQTVRSNK